MSKHTISNRYDVVRQIGKGGMASVFLAFDRLRRRYVAVKVLLPKFQNDKAYLEKLDREANLAMKLSHENIVTLYDVVDDGEMRYLIIEYVEGTTLKDEIRSRGFIPPDLAISWTLRILAGLGHAHKNHIIHRDIKPQNILVSQTRAIKVADFGIARAIDAERPGAEDRRNVEGSAHYISPEQAQGKPADARSDLYSVGIMLYEMLTGCVPFEGSTPEEIAYQHVYTAPKAPRNIRNGISKGLEEVVLRAIAKRPEDRYQSAKEMARDLKTASKHPRGGFVKRRRGEKPARGEKHHFPVVLTAVILLLVLATASMGFYISDMNRHVVIPNLLGRQAGEAEQLLDSLGIDWSDSEHFSDEYAAGTVAHQSIDGGTRVLKGTDLELIISCGTEQYEFADWVGHTENELRAAIGDPADFGIEFAYTASDAEPGVIVAQSAPAGQHSREEAVVMTVSGDPVVVPTLIGLSIENARAVLAAEGLTVGTVSESTSVDYAADTVMRQGIGAGLKVNAGTPIDLIVSRARSDVYYPDGCFSVPVPLDGAWVQVILEMPSGTVTEAYSARLDRGTYPVEISGSEQGNYVVRTYINGTLLDSTTLSFE